MSGRRGAKRPDYRVNVRLDSELDGTAWNFPVEVLRYWDVKPAA